VTRELRAVRVGPVHPGRGEPSYIELVALPAWLKSDQYVTARLTPAEAILLIEQLAMAVRVTA
jgi:hypothetical protein